MIFSGPSEVEINFEVGMTEWLIESDMNSQTK